MFGEHRDIYQSGKCRWADVEGRNPDGSIDYDFYRRRAAGLRAKSMRGALAWAGQFVRPIIAVAVIVGAIMAMPPSRPGVPAQTAEVANATVAGAPGRIR